MKINQQLLQINRNVIIGFVASLVISAIVAQALGEIENYQNTTITMIVGYLVYFAIFTSLFYRDNRSRYRQMEAAQVKREIIKMVTSFGLGEVVYLVIRWPTLYYLLEAEVEPFLASMASEIISTACYMACITVFLRKTRTF